MMRLRMSVFIAILLLTQAREQRVAWNAPVEPFRIIGNIYYVGAAGVSSFLIHTPEGAILLDGGLPETAPRILDNIRALGFDIRSVKYVINSHAHYDHAGGLAELKQRSGARLAVSEGDAAAIKAGGPDMPAVSVDRVLRDGDTIALGGSVMRAYVTPGHTKGCTTWTTSARDAGKDYRVLFHCSTSVVDALVRNAAYPHIVSDYQRTFARLAAMEADVFLGAHPSFFGMDGKRSRMKPGAANPFIDPSGLRRFNEESRRQFEAILKKEQAVLR